MKTVMIAVGVVALGLGSSACATKKYVNTRVADVNDQVAAVATTLEETQKATQKNEARIREVEMDVTRAHERADAADRAAAEAGSAAGAVNARVDKMEMASRRLVYEVVLTDDKAKFSFGRAMLSADARAEIDRLVQQVKSASQGVWIEVEGHTDSVGAAAFNEALGRERAEAVRRYLYEQHSVPLHKISVVSYGETKPIAPNTTREGRAMNRRVTVQVVG